LLPVQSLENVVGNLVMGKSQKKETKLQARDHTGERRLDQWKNKTSQKEEKL
jgi:hypothetical protein